MSSVVIAGDTSGSVTLQAPAVAGSTVLTLPTTSGTLVTTGGGSTGSFTTLTSTGASSFATSSGNVGIGTATPNVKLVVYGTDVRSSISDGTNSLVMGLWDGVNNRIEGAGRPVFITSYDTGIKLGYAGNEAMRIDSNNNVLIGTTGNATGNPKLNILAGSTTGRVGQLIANGSGSAGPAYIAFQGYDWVRGAVWHDRSSGYSLSFATNPNTADLSVNGLVARAAFNDAGSFFPVADNAYSCGASGQRWSAVWAANGTIQTSDLNAKTDIVESPLGLDFIKSLRPVAYKFKVGLNIVEQDPENREKTIVTPVAGKRQHFGLIAQEVKAALPKDVDFGGWAINDVNDKNSEQGLRYDEFISPLIKAIQEQQAIIEQLTTRISALENK